MDQQESRATCVLPWKKLHLIGVGALVYFGVTSFNGVVSFADTAVQGVEQTVATNSSANEGERADTLLVEDENHMDEAVEYEYQTAARPDPFKPFIAPKTVNPNELVDENVELTGMQLFEPGQLNLVAVMDTPGGRIAMVEDVTKKGYKISQGELIGRRGQVTEIRKDEVLVTETAYTRGGEEIKTVVSMKMKRDGDGK